MGQKNRFSRRQNSNFYLKSGNLEFGRDIASGSREQVKEIETILQLRQKWSELPMQEI